MLDLVIPQCIHIMKYHVHDEHIPFYMSIR
jgi:hypothetical protein